MNQGNVENSPEVGVPKQKPKVDQLGLEVIEKLRRGECAYYPRQGDSGWLYIPTAKVRLPIQVEVLRICM